MKSIGQLCASWLQLATSRPHTWVASIYPCAHPRGWQLWQGVLHTALLPSADAPQNEPVCQLSAMLMSACTSLLCRPEAGNEVRWRVLKLFTGLRCVWRSYGALCAAQMLAAKAYDLHNAELQGTGLTINTPETMWNVPLAEACPGRILGLAKTLSSHT